MPLYTTPLATTVIGSAIEVHRQLGPGLLESAYEHCLARELTLRGVTFTRQEPIPLAYKGARVKCAYRTDFLFGKELLLELKTVETIAPIHEAQVLTYMKLLGVRQGFLMNFNEVRLIDGLKSIVL